ncbi:MAG: RluA family pseudouridine synthase, partial [Treponema sp.]|nr:RluA family pseudouridine synthase [Treponema sp.]
MILRAAADDSGRRLDRILRKALPDLPLSALHALLRKGLILVDGRAAAPGFRVKAGALITAPAYTAA